jgi:prefoldin, archaeal alpha subunit/eukaryotic subunit 5
MNSKEALLNRKLIEYEYYKQLLENYQSQLTLMLTIYNEMENTSNCFEELKKLKEENVEMFASIGSGSYILINYKPNTKLLVHIGSKIYVEYTLEEAIDFLNRRKKKVIENIDNLNKIIQELSNIIARVEGEIAKLSEKS